MVNTFLIGSPATPTVPVVGPLVLALQPHDMYTAHQQTSIQSSFSWQVPQLVSAEQPRAAMAAFGGHAGKALVIAPHGHACAYAYGMIMIALPMRI